MMFISQIIAFFAIIVINGYFCFGVPSDRGVILGMWNPALLVTITKIPRTQTYFTNVTQHLTPSTIQILSITSDEQKKVVFFSILDAILAFQNFTIRPNKSRSLKSITIVHKGKSAAFGQIAFDYVSKNLYWCDSLLNWIAMKPAYGHDNSTYKIVVQEDLHQPEGLSLDPEDGLMFFSDNDINPRIEKASMNGKNRAVIIHNSLIRVLALTVDTVNNLLFWADVKRHTLEVSNYDGSSRRVLRRQKNVPLTGIHFHRNILHVVSAKAKVLAGFDATAGALMYGVNTSAQPFAIHVYNAETAKSHADPCSSRSCQQICVNTPEGATCLCSEGYQLSSDGYTCREYSFLYEKGFVVSNATLFSMLEVQAVNGLQTRTNAIRKSSAFIETFAVDSNANLIYFVDSVSNKLKKLNVITGNSKSLATIGIATDLNFDWIANILLWIEPTGSTIQAYSINSGSTTLIYNRLQRPLSLTVDAYNGYLFWLSGKFHKSIMRGTLLRDLPEAIVSTPNLNSPSSLCHDVTSKRLYWLDKSIIKSCMTNGSDIKSHIITLGATQIFAYKNFFGWIYQNKLHFARKSAISSENILALIQNPRKVVVYDSSLQRDKSGACNVMNGGCQDICVPLQSGRKCECDFGLQLQIDLKTCDNDVYSKNFLIVADNSHGRVLQIDSKTGAIVKLPISIQNSPGITIDKTTLELIYSDVSSKTIMSTTLHGKNTTLVYATGFAHADRLTIDYSTGNIYYSAVGSTSSQSYIGVVHRKSFLHKTLLFNLHRPKDVAVYPSRGFLYWTEIGNITEIGRSSMDGTSKTYIATTNIKRPNGLAIDFTSSRLYWTDGISDRIEFSDLNGGNRQVLTTDKDAHLMSIVIQRQFLYYTAWNRQGVTKLNKATGSKVTFMSSHPELGRLDSLDIYTDDPVDMSMSCSTNNGNCSTFCFPTPKGRTCGCEDNVNLKSDQTTCQGVPRCTDSLQNVNLLNCLPYPGQTCLVECKSGYRLNTVNISVTCDRSGQWFPSPMSLCTGNISVQGNIKDFNKYVYIGSSIAAIAVVIIFVAALTIACFLKRRNASSRLDSYQRSPAHVEHNYSVIRNRGYLTGSYRADEQEPAEYVTIDDQYNTEYEEPLKDTYLNPVYTY